MDGRRERDDRGGGRRAVVLLLTASLACVLPATAQPLAEIAARPLPGVPAEVAALLLEGRAGGAFAMGALALPRFDAGGGDGDGEASAELWVELDGAGLLGEGSAGERLTVEFYAYALADGGVAGHLALRASVDLEALGAALAAGGLKLRGDLELPPGEYDLRVLARERSSQRFALRRLRLRFPDPAGSAPLVTPLRFRDPLDDWIVALDGRNRADESDDVGRDGVIGADGDGDGGWAGPPAAIPVLVAGREHVAELDGWGILPQPPRATIRFRGPDGRVAGETTLPLRFAEDRAPADDAGRLRLTASVAPPAALATGNYLLETTPDGAVDATAQPVYVLGTDLAALPDEPPPWTGVRALFDAAPRRDVAPREDETPRRRRKAEVTRLAAAYRDALATLATGAYDDALAALQDLESAVAKRDPAAAAELLAAAQSRVADELAEHDPECLVPLILAYHDLHDRYVAARQFPLAALARARTVALAERYAAESGSELAPALAAEAMASMGAYLLQAQLRNPGRELLARALELDPRNVFARLHLALALERAGDYPLAVEVLRELVAVDPDAGEGRLRLALNLCRTGAEDEATRLLRRLIDDGADDWILILAYQELARLRLAAEHPAEAVTLLERAVGRLPDAGRLHLLLAYALDRDGRAGRGREVLARATLAGATPSPRHLYNRRAGEERGQIRRSLARAGLGRLPALARALTAREDGEDTP